VRLVASNFESVRSADVDRVDPVVGSGTPADVGDLLTVGREVATAAVVRSPGGGGDSTEEHRPVPSPSHLEATSVYRQYTDVDQFHSELVRLASSALRVYRHEPRLYHAPLNVLIGV
jgi:hypothetical protein